MIHTIQHRNNVKIEQHQPHPSLPMAPVICIIPAAPAYGVNISGIMRYSKACGLNQDFLNRVLMPSYDGGT
jgi:hypothetical protein